MWLVGKLQKRHPEVTLHVAEHLSHAQALACNSDTLSSYFDLLEQSIEDNDLRSYPSQIFNYSETSMPLDQKPPKPIVQKEPKHPGPLQL